MPRRGFRELSMSVSSPPPEWLLAIDTSTERSGLALTDSVHTNELTWHAGRDQTVTTLAEIDHLVTLLGISFERIGAIAIATGPGMFNGLRVGMSIAKGLHLAHGTPLIGVSTLEFTAEPMRNLAPTVLAVVAAGRGRLVWQPFPGNEPPINGAVAELADAIHRLPSGTVVAGELTGEQARHLREHTTALVPDATLRVRRPGALAALGLSRWRDGRFDDPIALAPMYVHTSVASGRG
jgi:tRNA threonylcarbamoyladenosine biosynthesis protein TsaB